MYDLEYAGSTIKKLTAGTIFWDSQWKAIYLESLSSYLINYQMRKTSIYPDCVTLTPQNEPL